MSIRLLAIPAATASFVLQCNLVECEPESMCPGCLNTNEHPHDCGLCYNCCSCGICRQCDNLAMIPPCTACGLCRNCCQCYQCRGCGATHTHRDMLCTRCGCGIASTGCGCCSHSSSNRITASYVKTPVNLALYTPTKPGELTLNPSARLLAAEMEICGLHASFDSAQQILKAWHCSVVGDGSLPSGGFEINTHPAGGNFFPAQIEDICRGLQESRAWVDKRAGCHMHVDARDLGYLGIIRLLRLCACLEPAFWALIPAVRRNSSYCAFWAPRYLKAIHDTERGIDEANKTGFPISDRKILVKYRNCVTSTLYNTTSKSDVREHKSSKNGGSRYRALNLHSWFYRGTIEFRMPPGTIYPSNVINWGLLLGNIVDLAASRTPDEIRAITKPLESRFQKDACYASAYHSLPEKLRDESLELLKNLTPSTIVRDWVSERIVAMKRLGNDSYSESY